MTHFLSPPESRGTECYWLLLQLSGQTLCLRTHRHRAVERQTVEVTVSILSPISSHPHVTRTSTGMMTFTCKILSAENEFFQGNKWLKDAIGGYNDPWLKTQPIYGPKPQPDHTHSISKAITQSGY